METIRRSETQEKLAAWSTMPEFQPAIDVDVWETESVFVHVTVVPTATFNASGRGAIRALRRPGIGRTMTLLQASAKERAPVRPGWE